MAESRPWDENYIPEPNSGCWIWMGGLNDGGYGICYPAGAVGGQHRIHRLMYERSHGPIPEGMDVLHTCDIPRCCNPDHLYAGTDIDNARDRVLRGRQHDQRGEKSNSVKLTRSNVEAIRASDKSQTALAQEYGVSQSLISRIKSKHRW